MHQQTWILRVNLVLFHPRVFTLFIPADDSMLPLPLLKTTYDKLPLTSQPLSINHANPAFTPFLFAEGLSSMETLLTNIQVTELT